MQDSTTALDVDDLGLSYTTNASDEAMHDTDGKDGSNSLDSDSDSEGSSASDCSDSDDLIAAMYESGNSDSEEYQF